MKRFAHRRSEIFPPNAPCLSRLLGAGFCALVCFLSSAFLEAGPLGPSSPGSAVLSETTLAQVKYRAQRRLLERAERYVVQLSSREALSVERQITIVCGLLEADIPVSQPFLAGQITLLERRTPKNAHEARLLRRARLFVQLARTGETAAFFSGNQLLLRSELTAYQETYRRFGIPVLPRGFDPESPPVKQPTREDDVSSLFPAVGGSGGKRNDVPRWIGPRDEKTTAGCAPGGRTCFSPVLPGYERIILTDRRRE